MRRPMDEMERLISRRLDGALSPEEELQLDRELIRNPDARRLLDDYTRMDGLVAAVLDRTLAHEGATIDVENLKTNSPARSGYLGIRWLVPGAAAAAVLAMVIARGPFQAGPGTMQPADRNVLEAVSAGVPRSMNDVWGPRVAPANGSFMRDAWSSLPSSVNRDSGRETIGVLGEDGVIYWIEIDRTRMVRRASPQLARQWATGGV